MRKVILTRNFPVIFGMIADCVKETKSDWIVLRLYLWGIACNALWYSEFLSHVAENEVEMSDSVVSRKRKGRKKFHWVATRWYNPRRIFPDVFPHVYFLATRWHDKRPWDVRRGSLRRRSGNGHVKNGKLNRRRINSWPKINALYVRRVGSTSVLMKERPAFRTCSTRHTRDNAGMRDIREWLAARLDSRAESPQEQSLVSERIRIADPSYNTIHFYFSWRAQSLKDVICVTYKNDTKNIKISYKLFYYYVWVSV